ncbi:hypothetical protein [Fulvimonas yonginensis]|uniref:Uncharacterized protein n=1 Tax=Fulvimonas yonginensis TaxID=1495200 RepID=A0ABU8JA47_9GAMM
MLYPFLLALAGHTAICLLSAGVCAVAAASLLHFISGTEATAAPPLSNPHGGPVTEQPNNTVLAQALVIVYLVAMAAVLCALGLWGGRHGPQGVALMATISGCYFAIWSLWLVSAFGGRTRRTKGGLDQATLRHPFARFVLATIAAATLAGPLLVGLQTWTSRWYHNGLWNIITFGPTCVLAGVMLTGIVHVGLAGPALTDLQREIWARVAGKAAAVIVGSATILLLVLYLPRGMARVAGVTVNWVSVGTWVLTTGMGVFAAYSKKSSSPKSRFIAVRLLARAAPAVFLVGLIVAISWATMTSLNVLAGSCTEHCLAFPDLRTLEDLAIGRGRLATVLAFDGALAVWALFGIAIDVNEFSMNAFYRNRLVRCYLGASNDRRKPEPTTNFDPDDDMLLARVAEGPRDRDGARPLYPLICATLNLVDTKQLDWQDRKAASFVFTPGYCGYVPPPSHSAATPIGDRSVPQPPCPPEEGHAGNAFLSQTLMLGSALAISGAAVSPNMGYHSSPAVTLLLTLFDARLGWWLPNPVARDRAVRKKAPQITFYGEWLVREMLGRTREEGDYLYLSDGGHFENLGIYELVRRRCGFILCVDGSADPDRCFADLGNAIQKCRTDFGCIIDIDVSDLRCGPDGLSRRHCAIGRIEYERGKPGGVLFYIKPSLTGNESADIAYYARTHPSFPHESTADQYFDEAQFESYRRLGRDIAAGAFRQVIERVTSESRAVARPMQGFGLARSDLRDSLLRELQYHWVAPLKGMDAHFSRHAHAMASLFAKLRREPSLSALDAHLYPAWDDMMRTVPARTAWPLTTLPNDKDFRACFYFCQELVQLMESVYHDLDLEHAWDHPDNRGWLNAFRQWSWSPMFRIAWAAGSAMYGKPFVSFCELRLGLPALEKREFTETEHHLVAPGASWSERCNALLEGRKINPLEHGILLAPALAPAVGNARVVRELFLLRLRWSSITVRSACPLGNTTVGLAVIADSVLCTLRIQDHVRRMGLAGVFMWHIARSSPNLAGVNIREGDYGQAGFYTREQAEMYTRRLKAMLEHARSVAC